jgi:uncharacterized membrane protein YdjX (TVP38/TMEM64 family)
MRNFFIYLIVVIPAGILAGLALGSYLDSSTIQESPISKFVILVVFIVGVVFAIKGGKKK